MSTGNFFRNLASRIHNEWVTGICAGGLSFGFFDQVLAVLGKPTSFSQGSNLLLPLSASILGFMAIFLAMEIPFRWGMKMGDEGDSTRLAPTWALSLWTFLGVASLTGLTKMSALPGMDGFSMSVKLGIGGLFAFLVGAGAHHALHRLQNRTDGSVQIQNALVSFPLCLGWTLGFVWMVQYRLEPPSIGRGLLLVLAYLFGAVILLAGVRLLLRRVPPGPILLVAVLFFLVNPFFMQTGSTAVTSPSAKSKYPAHLICGIEILPPTVTTPSAKRERPVPYVFLITIDTLRADALKDPGMPNLHRLAEDGISFTRGYAPSPWTLPSMASILTGLDPSLHGATRMDSVLPNGIPTLAEYMKGAGYATAGIGRNYLLIPERNLNQGFDYFDFYPKYSLGDSLGAELLVTCFPARFRYDVSTENLTDLTESWLNRNGGRDFFLWLHYFDPHVPYEAPIRYLPLQQVSPSVGVSFSGADAIRSGHFVPSADERKWIRELYRGEVRMVDENLGRLVDRLKRMGIYDKALIVVTSDHGEEFWEHGGFEHGHSLYNELLRVPLIIKPPAGRPKREIDLPVSNQRVVGTILDFCSIRREEDRSLSPSLKPLILGGDGDEPPAPIYGGFLLYGEPRESVLFDGFKYIRSPMDGTEELYDLARDPEERDSLISRFPEQVELAREYLEIHKQETDAVRNRLIRGAGSKREPSPETAQGLRSLGYVQ